jgi:hypothetical protein
LNPEQAPNLRGVPLILHWDRLEPEQGQYLFGQRLGEPLRRAAEHDLSVVVMLWVGPHAPDWVYDNGVPLVKTKGHNISEFPYYFDSDYQKYFRKLISRYSDYLGKLPSSLRQHIVTVQVCEGSTGDGYGYKGTVIDDAYKISRKAWGKYRMRVWRLYHEEFADGPERSIPFTYNFDANGDEEKRWLLEHGAEIIGAKQGMFSHGYHIPKRAGPDRYREWQQFVEKAHASGREVFTRGELDREWIRTPWSAQNKEQSLYWNAIYATHTGLDIWNATHPAITQPFEEPLEFFNRYAGHHNPAEAPAAFVALRRGLDASNTEAFPESKFGKADKQNVDRYLAIAEAFSERGAQQADPQAALAGGMKHRRRDGYNDVGWGFFPNNYQRFMTQLHPNETSLGLWHVGGKETIYGRFARRFDHASGKDTMYFRLSPEFFKDDTPRDLRVSVTYYDEGEGSWALGYEGANGEKRLTESVATKDTGRWRKREFQLKKAVFDQGLRGRADLTLEFREGNDTAFHMVEVIRQ